MNEPRTLTLSYPIPRKIPRSISANVFLATHFQPSEKLAGQKNCTKKYCRSNSLYAQPTFPTRARRETRYPT